MNNRIEKSTHSYVNNVNMLDLMTADISAVINCTCSSHQQNMLEYF
jgi:hypothetical protein